MLAIAMGRQRGMLRIRKGWRQSDVAEKAKLSASVIGRHEAGVIGSNDALERHAGVLGMRVEVRIIGRAGELARLGDEEHAAIVETLATWFREEGFLVEVESSFSEWGERGRIGLLAYDPTTGTLVIVEVKTLLLDLQDLFGSMNVKERLAAVPENHRVTLMTWGQPRETALGEVAAKLIPTGRAISVVRRTAAFVSSATWEMDSAGGRQTGSGAILTA